MSRDEITEAVIVHRMGVEVRVTYYSIWVANTNSEYEKEH